MEGVESQMSNLIFDTGTSQQWGSIYDTLMNYNTRNQLSQSYYEDMLNDLYKASHYKVTAENVMNGEITVKQVVENETQKIKKVIFSDPATIVLWEDGTKTVVKTQKGDAYDPEKGLAIACMRKILSKKDYHYWLEEARGKNTPINEEIRSKGV